MNVEQLALVRGWHDTRVTLRGWRARPAAVVAPWVTGSLAVAVALLVATWVVAILTVPDPMNFARTGTGKWGDFGYILYRNALVLALHAMACVAGFIAGSSLPLEAQQRSGAWRWIHEKAGQLAILFVIAATAFSLMTQAIVLGAGAASLSAKLVLGPGLLLLGLLPHALPELVALFLPLAAWMIASRQNDWHQLLAATVVTVLLAVPVIVASAFVEVYFSPGLLRWLAG